jgi:uncharacterized protein
LKLHADFSGPRNMVHAYGPGYVTIQQTRYERSLIVFPDELLSDWAPADLAALRPEDFEPLIARRPEVVLIGTGSRLRFPGGDVLRPLMDAQVGFEIMDVQAACRTYNILLAEERKVAAALLLGD